MYLDEVGCWRLWQTGALLGRHSYQQQLGVQVVVKCPQKFHVYLVVVLTSTV
jgi:hypothetical protein